MIVENTGGSQTIGNHFGHPEINVVEHACPVNLCTSAEMARIRRDVVNSRCVTLSNYIRRLADPGGE